MALRILNVTQCYPPAVEASGQALTVQALSRHLACRGHRVTVLTADRGGGGALTNGEVEVVSLASALRYRMCTLNPGVIHFCHRRLRDFDIVHLYGLYDLLGPVVAGFCRRWHIPYVLEPLGMFRPVVRNIGMKRLYHQLLGWRLVQGAVRVIATSERERDEMIAEGVAAAQVVIRRNGVDAPDPGALTRGAFRRDIGLDEEAPLVLYLGRVSRIKGLDLLVEALYGLPSAITLAIVGPDDGDGCLRHLERLRAEFGLQGRVHLLGPRFGPDKYAALADADVFVLPSRSESFGNAAAEAVGCGVPVIVTENCGIASLLRDRAALVVPCEVRALRSAVARVLADRALRARLRDGAASARLALSWDEPLRAMQRLYLECTRH